VVAVLGELVGSRTLSPEIVELVKRRSDLQNSFLDMAGLVQQGWTARSLTALLEAGALEPVVTLLAPKGAVDWDVEHIRARPGDHLDAGAVVVECRDLSHVLLGLVPAGPDLAAIAAALSAGEKVSAEPLLKGSGPTVEGLQVLQLEADPDADHPAAIVPVENVPLPVVKRDGREYRSWALRPGLRYLVRIPVERKANVFVLPADAVATQGPDTVLLLEDGDSFKAVAVRVFHRDSRTVVVGNDGAVFPGDRAVLRGAYSVMLAIQASAGKGADAHAGCGHQH
jgi:hypothetical protein